MNEQRQEQLSRIVVKGYKSIKDCDLELGNINLLIGSNGAGKSNLVSTFTLLQNILAEELQLYAKKKGISSLFYNGSKTTDALEMCFYFGRDTYSYEIGKSEDNSLFFRSEKFSHYANERT